MRRLATFFVLAGLFALAACDMSTGPIFAECSPSNCPPPNSCQVPNEEGLFDGIPVCTSRSGASAGVAVTAPARRDP